jgi:hypothetical protein
MAMAMATRLGDGVRGRARWRARRVAGGGCGDGGDDVGEGWSGASGVRWWRRLRRRRRRNLSSDDVCVCVCVFFVFVFVFVFVVVACGV